MHLENGKSPSVIPDPLSVQFEKTIGHCVRYQQPVRPIITRLPLAARYNGFCGCEEEVSHLNLTSFKHLHRPTLCIFSSMWL